MWRDIARLVTQELEIYGGRENEAYRADTIMRRGGQVTTRIRIMIVQERAHHSGPLVEARLKLLNIDL